MRDEHAPPPDLSIAVIRAMRAKRLTTAMIATELRADFYDVLRCEREAETAEFMAAYRAHLAGGPSVRG